MVLVLQKNVTVSQTLLLQTTLIYLTIYILTKLISDERFIINGKDIHAEQSIYIFTNYPDSWKIEMLKPSMLQLYY